LQERELTHKASQADPAARSLSLATLYLTERCNSRCLTCDYWRSGRESMTLESVARWLPSFAELKTRVVLISGGEPLLNPEWIEIARLLKSRGLELWLLTSGLSLAKHAADVRELFSSVTVSLDGTNDRTYAAIRGVNAFDKVCEGIRRVARLGAHVGVRVTVQRANYEELSDFVALAKETGARQISFLAADVSNPHAFGRTVPNGIASDIALRPDDLPKLEKVLHDLQRDRAQDFASGFIAESPGKLRRILDYYAAILGRGSFPPVRCNAPEFSAVIEATGRVRPCFFIPSPGAGAHAGLKEALNEPAMVSLRRHIREQRRAECATCVCSMWRDLDTIDVAQFSLARGRSA
jgi:MoaA/NifB/PqqE/SkfB family radical SAM enzyme